MVTRNGKLKRLYSFSIITGIVVFAISDSYSESDFLWLGSEQKGYNTARVYMKNGPMLAGLMKMDRKKNVNKRPAIKDIEETKIHNFNLINLNGRKIRPFETDSIVINSLTGLPFNDTLWLFKIIEGKITVFNTKPYWKSKEYTHIHKDGFLIQRYSHELLKNHLNDNEYALSLLQSPSHSKSKVLSKYEPERAILEYNFKTTSTEFKTTQLMQELQKEKDVEKRMSYCKEIIMLDSSQAEPYEILGDYALQKNNIDEAYLHYTSYLRYCPREPKMNRVRKKIKKIQKEPIY